MRIRALLPLLLALLCLSACRSAPNRHASRITPAPRVVLGRSVVQGPDGGCGTAAAAAQPLAQGSHANTISAAYRDVMREFIRPLDSTSLLSAAWQGATDEAAKEGDADPGVAAPQLSDASADADWQTFATAYDSLSQATDGQVDQIKLAFAAVTQMAKSVDEGHTFFVDPETYAQESAGREQSFSGIGVELNGKEAPFIIEEVVQGAPADQAGMRPGDSITNVDGCDVGSWDSLQLSTHVRGPSGTTVHLTINRPTQGTLELDVMRAQVTFPAIVQSVLPSGVGYIHLHEFPGTTDILVGGKPLTPALTSILSSFKDAGARGWILDLRGNPGGLVPAVQAVGGLVLARGTVFSSSDRAGHKTTNRTIGNRVSDPPLLAVLVDAGSASGSEILSAAIQDEGVAPIIGATTAGVANEAVLEGIGDGAGLSITHFQTYSPDGRPINGQGVTPDISVERTATDLAAGIDPPLDRAVDLAAPK